MTPESLRGDLARLRSGLGPRWPRASAHGWRLRPPLAEDEARAFEERHGVALPGEYREFLTRFGDGGAGPANGLFALADVELHLHERAKAWRPLLASPARPFPAPLTLAESRRVPYVCDGALIIADFGCGSDGLIVVSGDERGHLWYRSQDGECLPMCLSRPDVPAGATPGERERAYDAFNESRLGPRGRGRVRFWPWYTAWLAGCLGQLPDGGVRRRGG